ncbi:hypothetical protein LCGC14_3092160 [marine sediment metagenome]|uniref:HTH cro/C1-type domain-containing protein n=1 Tax=marine sediment metagenome TaxID=412755 RepID=A0A0F8WYZ8_9ZZZZ
MIHFEVETLSQAMQVTMVLRKASIRDIAKELGMNASTVWRVTRYPLKSSAVNLLRIVNWMGIGNDTFWELWQKELQPAPSDKEERSLGKTCSKAL